MRWEFGGVGDFARARVASRPRRWALGGAGAAILTMLVTAIVVVPRLVDDEANRASAEDFAQYEGRVSEPTPVPDATEQPTTSALPPTPSPSPSPSADPDATPQPEATPADEAEATAPADPAPREGDSPPPSGSEGTQGEGSGGSAPAEFSGSDQAASGSTFYVDLAAPSGGDGSIDAPFDSLGFLFSEGLIESRNYTSFPASAGDPTVPRNPGAPIQPGDTIVLASGNYGVLDIRGYVNSAPITITSADGQQARFAGVRITGATNWVLDGVRVDNSQGAVDKYLVQIDDNYFGPAERITIRNSLIETASDTSGWSVADWNSRQRTGISLRSSGNDRGHVIENNTIRNVNHGVVVWGNNAVVSGNSVDMFGGDGIRAVASDNARYVGNRISNNVNINDNHDDGFQHFPSYDATSKPTRNVVVSGNTVINCEGTNPLCGPLQGIVSFDGRIEGWEVTDNTVISNHWHGISMYDMHDSLIEGNRVRDPGQLPDVGPTWLRVSASKNGTPASDVIVRCNIVNSITQTAGNVNITVERNTLSNDPSASFAAGC